MTAATFLAVVAAGAVGAVARAALSAVIESRWRRGGAGTLVVNLLGAFALGAWLGSTGHVDTVWLRTIGTGFLGAFTTFSTWMVALLARWRAGDRLGTLTEGLLTMTAGVLAAALGASWSAAAFG